MTDPAGREEFSVYQFFPDATYERVAWFVDLAEAMRIAKMLTQSLGARVGTTLRVIVTDGGDHTVFEWLHGEGITWPARHLQ